MISYQPFWDFLKNSDETWYTLVHKHNINPATLSRMKHSKPISTVTIDMLCKLLKCNTEDIICYIPDGENENE